jgi:hypothetical protein
MKDTILMTPHLPCKTNQEKKKNLFQKKKVGRKKKQMKKRETTKKNMNFNTKNKYLT